MNREVEPITKEEQVRRVWVCKAGTDGCLRTAPCRSCLGRRNRRQGLRKQRAVRKGLGIPSARFAARNSDEENWSGALRVEAKSGQQVVAMAARYLAAERQSEASRAIGDVRPFVFCAMPTQWGGDGLFVCRLSQVREVVQGLLATWDLEAS